MIDWGKEGSLHIFCAVLAWSRVRFVRFATDEKADTTLRLLAECFETLGGVPKVVLADRMGCLKGGVVANVVIPTADYVRFATWYGFRPDFREGGDPESKGIVENLVGYAKSDLVVPAGLDVEHLEETNVWARCWCEEVNGRPHSEICAVPAQRLVSERDLLGLLPSLRPRCHCLRSQPGDQGLAENLPEEAATRPARFTLLLWRAIKKVALRRRGTTTCHFRFGAFRSWQCSWSPRRRSTTSAVRTPPPTPSRHPALSCRPLRGEPQNLTV